MKKNKKTKQDNDIYTDEDYEMPVGKITRVPDFLPPPEVLFSDHKLIKITISLTDSSVAYYKEIAKKYGFKYQQLMRSVLDRYVVEQKKNEHKKQAK